MKFIPKVGDKCYVTHPKGNSDCEILGISGGYVWFKVFNHICFSFLMTKCEFKPIKSPAEIEREELAAIIYGGGRLDSADLAKMIIDAGWSKQQVKPLSFIMLDEIASSNLHNTGLYTALKPYTIQGGDK